MRVHPYITEILQFIGISAVLSINEVHGDKGNGKEVLVILQYDFFFISLLFLKFGYIVVFIEYSEFGEKYIRNEFVSLLFLIFYPYNTIYTSKEIPVFCIILKVCIITEFYNL